MRRFRRSSLGPSAGFALIELLVTVAIIAVISLVALPNLREALDRGKQTATRADMKAIATALERYAYDHDLYPEVEALSDLEDAVVPRYLKELPLDDAWGWSYELVVEKGGDGFLLRSPGKDGTFGDAEQRDEGSTESKPNPFARDLVMVDGVFLDPEDRDEGAAQGRDESKPPILETLGFQQGKVELVHLSTELSQARVGEFEVQVLVVIHGDLIGAAVCRPS